MKVAVCISGELRYFEHELVQSGLKFIYNLNPDIFISTWSHKGFSYNTKREDIFNKRNDIEQDLYNRITKSYTNIKSIEIENYDEWVLNLDEFTKNVMSGRLIGGEVVTSPPQLYKLYKCNLLKKQYEVENNFKYDVVIRIRPDVIFVDNIDLSDINSISHINFGRTGSYWPNRIFDIFFYSNSDNMDILSNTFMELEENINYDLDNGLDRKDCCRLLYVQAYKNKINIKDLTTRVCEVYRNESYNDFINRIKWLNNT